MSTYTPANIVSGTYNANDPSSTVEQQQALMPNAVTQPSQGGVGNAISQATKNIVAALMRNKQQQQQNQQNQQQFQQAIQPQQPMPVPQQANYSPAYGGMAMFQPPPSAAASGGGWGDSGGGY